LLLEFQDARKGDVSANATLARFPGEREYQAPSSSRMRNT